MKKSRLSIILLSLVAALAAGAILIGALNYFVLNTNAESSPAQERSLVITPTSPVTPNNQLPSVLDSNNVQVREGEAHEAGESEEREREEHELGENESGERND